MKNDEITHYYESVFAAYMAAFIRYKRAQGLKYDAVPRSLRSFSRFLSAEEADDASIGQELIEKWCSFRSNENRLTQRRRIVETTQFLKYLSERGVDVHLPHPTRKSRAREAFVPYIFSNEELRRFFEECDRISARTPSMMPAMLPVLFRLLLGCGLRISEALELRLGDTDLDNGILVIRKSPVLALLLGRPGCTQVLLWETNTGAPVSCALLDLYPAILAFIEGIYYLTMNDRLWALKHGGYVSTAAAIIP